MRMMNRTKTKYKNTKIKVDGETFDSKAEYRRYLELQILEKAKKIKNLQRQPKFVLQEGFRYADGSWIRPITYAGDFQYVDENNKTVVEDVKSWITKQDTTYKIKVKLLKKRFSDIVFKEVVK